MSVLYMLVGVPGAGKSTWVKNMMERSAFEGLYTVVSSDNIIEDMAKQSYSTYDETFKHVIDHANKLSFKLAELAIEKERIVIWDQTNLTVKTRARKLKIVPETYYKIAVAFSHPKPEELEQRLNRPGKTIPKSLVYQMQESFEAPTFDEGFQAIWNV